MSVELVTAPAVHAGVFDRINNLTSDAESTTYSVIFLIILFIVAGAIWRSRGGVSAVVSALLMAAVGWWAVNNIDFLEGEVDDTITSAPALTAATEPANEWPPAPTGDPADRGAPSG